jgi:hypothetical protein
MFYTKLFDYFDVPASIRWESPFGNFHTRIARICPEYYL